MKNWKTAVGLGVTLLALSGIATWDEWQTKKDEKDKETSNLLINWKPDQIKSFVFHTAGDSDTGGDKTPSTTPKESAKAVDISAKLVDGKWVVTSPVNETADQQVIQDLLKNITEYKFEKEIASGKDKWAQFGLAEPRRRIELENSDNSKLTIYVGMNAPVGFSTYVATSTSDKILTGSQYLATSLAKTLFDFRNKKLLSISTHEIDKVLLKAEAEKGIELAKADGKWQIKAPEAAEADSIQVNNFLDDITGLRAAEFVDKPTKDQIAGFAPTKTFASLTLSVKDVAYQVKFAKINDTLFASIDPTKQVIKLGEDAKGKIAKKVNDFRNKKMFDFQSAQVETIEIDNKVYVRVSDEWYSKDDAAKFDATGKFPGKESDKPAPRKNIRGLLVDLEYAKAEAIFAADSIVAKKLPTAPKNRLKLTFNTATNRAPMTIDIWQAGDIPDQIYVRSSGKSAVFMAKASIIASMSGAPVLPAEDAKFPNQPPPNEQNN